MATRNNKKYQIKVTPYQKKDQFSKEDKDKYIEELEKIADNEVRDH